jgi:hypothetical protein
MHNTVLSEISEYVDRFIFKFNAVIYHTTFSTTLANASAVLMGCQKKYVPLFQQLTSTEVCNLLSQELKL